MASNKLLIKPVCMAAAILGSIQGLVWTVFSILSILLFFSVMEPDVSTTDITYSLAMYEIFLQKYDTYPDDNILVNAKVFNGLMYPYLILSICWLILSICLLQALFRDKWTHTTIMMYMWSGITIIISILDIVLVSLLAHDYNYVNSLGNVIDIFLTSYGIVMSIAARGYVLWLGNVIFAGILIKFAIDVDQKETDTMSRPIINAYSDSSMYPPVFSTNTNNTNIYDTPNSTFPIDRTNSMFIRSESIDVDFQNRKSATNNNNVNRNYPSSFPNQRAENPYANSVFEKNSSSLYNNDRNRVASIGKPGRSKSSNGARPYIPPPDYTPPGSPTSKPKSVLRSRSNYVI